MSNGTPPTYTIAVSAEIVETFTDWTRIADLGADWIKAVPHADGTAEVILAVGDTPPEATTT